MTEEDAVFDASLKKKKKKKKTPFDLDGAMNEDEQVSASKTAAATDAGPPTDAPATADADEPVLDDIDLEGFGKKKKKKKALNLKDLEEALPDEKDGEGNEDVDLESFGKKRKKKKRTTDMGQDETNAENKENEAEESVWIDSDRDYTYDELLQRVYNIIKDKNPDSAVGEKKKLVMRPPQVMKVGAKKTAFVNFTEIAKMLHRQPKHLLSFLSAELGTVGSVDGNNQLVMKGKFQQKHIENVLRRYIKEYVTCHTCRSPDTILNKETRLFFLQCMTCHSRCSVQTIKSGFQAVTGKRSAIRAKQ